MTLRTRLDQIAMALFGPADTGPYGPPVAPPSPRLRDAHRRLITKAKVKRSDLAATTSAAAVSAAVAAAVAFATIGDVALFADSRTRPEAPGTNG